MFSVLMGFWKSADEKLRGIGKQPPGIKPTGPSGFEEPDEMAERRIQLRQGRRDNFRGNDATRGQQDIQQEKIEIKRRSRSEGPTRRVRQRDDKRVHQSDSFAKGDNVSRPNWDVEETSTATRVSRYSPPISDDGGFIRDAGSDSDSYDSDPKVWTKNQLMSRRSRRSGAYSDKRRSNINNDAHISTRDSFVYYSTTGQDKSDSSGTGGSFKGNKFQKIEERRKKRIDIQMTSDEENSPEYRISRLRQRALQSGLGRQSRIELPDTLSPSVFTQKNVPKNYQQNTRNSGAYSNTPFGANNNNNNYHNQHNQNVLSNAQGNFVPQTSPGYQHNNVQQRQYQQTTSKTTPPQQNTQQNSDPVPFGSPQTARVMTYGKLINNEPIRNPYSGVNSSDSGQVRRNNQSANFGIFKNSRTNSVDNTTSPTKNNRFVYNSSPEVGRKFDLSAARGSSIDSVYDTGVAPEPASRSGAFRRYNQHIGVTSGFQTGFSVDKDQKPVYVNPPSNQTMEIQRGSVVKYPMNSVQLQSSRSPRVNETCELRFDTNRLMEGPLSPVSPKEYRHFNRAHSEDSLDEIVMSNAQFLESNMGKARNNIKSQVPVSRSASLPDQKRQGMIQNRARGSAEIVVPFGYSKKPIVQAAPYRHHMEKSELEIRVPMPGANKWTPEITIANENLNDPSDYSYNYNGNVMHMSSGFGAPRQERKLSYDSRSGYSRPTSQYFERDDISKSDSQLNTATVPPSTYRGEQLHPMSHYKQPKSLSADQLLPPGTMGVVHSRPTESGMFSDVEYDIEVSDRIRKWETYMKKSNEPFSNGNALTTIQERTEEFGLTPYDNRQAAPRDIPRPVAITSSQSWNTVEPMAMKPSSSDPTVHLLGEPQIISHETNTHRLFQLVPGVRAHSTSNSMGALIQSQAPIQSRSSAEKRSLPTLHYALNMPETPLTAGKLKQKMIADRQSSLESSSTESPILSDKGSKYMRYQEIDDMTGSKDESVKDLCKLFNFNEDSEGRRIAKISPQKQDDEWAKIISDMEDNIKKTDVWSPHMESTKGESLSIERVKARTLQTIPFQDDPFWKEIEEMTSFESLVGQKQGDQMASYDDQFIVRNQNQGDTSQSQSSTLPNQPRLTTSSRDRLQRSKSLYTPNIAPLTLGMPPRSHNSQTTLEDAIEDLKTSVDRTSTRDSLDSKSSSQTQSISDFKVSAPVRSSMYIENVQMRDQPKKIWSQHRGSGVYDIPENVSVKDMYTFSTEPGQAFPNVVNGNYELDPNLLKHKLLSTGLVEENVDSFYNEHQDSGDYGKQPPKYQETITATSKPVANTAPQRFYQSENKVNQVSQSMEDLRQLAKNVENKIELIKSKLVQADDTNLDKILVALRKFAPSAGPRSPDIRSETMHDFYQSKRSKLSDALTELERIYKNLDLENETLYDRADRRDYPSYHRLSPAPLNDAPPVRETTSLSIEIASPVFNDRADVEKQTQSEFDAISKSFQAILDEVNQTSAVTTSSEDVWISGPQSTPDSPRLPMRVTLKSTQIPSPTSKSPNQSVSTVSDSDTPSRLRKSRQRFRSKIPDVVGDDVALRKARSKSSPRIEAAAAAPPSPTTADYLNPREMSAAKGRIRIRPEKEPDVMHDDMAYRNLIQRETSENKTSSAKSSIQIELSSPESPQVKSELVFESILIGDKKSKIVQPVPPPVSPIPPSVSPIPSDCNVKHEPKIMGTVQHVGNQQRQIRSLQLGKTSSLPTKIQPKEIVTASKKIITVSQNKDEPEPVQIKTVALVKLPKESKSASSTAVSKTLVQQTKILPRDQSNKDNKESSKVEANVECKSPMQGEIKPNSRVEIKIPLIAQKTDNVPEVNVGTNGTKKPETTGPLLKMPITKVQPPKLATSKLAKFLPVAEQPKSKMVGLKPESGSCKDTKLRVPTKTPKVVPPSQKNIKTELKLATGNKTTNGKSKQGDKSPKLAEKEIIIKLPTAFSSTVPDTATTSISTNSSKQNAENIPEKRTVETQTSPAKDKSTKSKQADRRQKYRKYGRGVAGMVDLFSSSDEDRHRATKPLLTRSAPDLSLLSLDDDDDHVDDDLVDDPTSKGTQAEITEDATDLDESDAVFTDDVAPVSPTPKIPNSAGTANNKDAKPPAHPSSVKNTNTPDIDKPRPSGDAKDKTNVNISVCSDIDKSVQLRRRHSLERTVIDDADRDERPKSFHELLESFETNKTKKRIHRMRSLRKCVSEDAMITEMVVAKVYHSDVCLSEPDLSENSNRIPSKEGRVFLKVEMQIKS
ncbi:uncharacterized protein LOC126831453 isoform X4 [Patella vulgata]|uniref:uncharacterized protein LOC126831453 isoform X4 n=1 Tax=Patella vulgata TaxID=6465 RepID=UPI0024A81B34|nr:uncharacterized protein LOC126831453 isoform X4 [Patella vulgata]